MRNSCPRRDQVRANDFNVYRFMARRIAAIKASPSATHFFRSIMNASLSLVNPSERSFQVANAVVPGQTDQASQRFRLPAFLFCLSAENSVCRPIPVSAA